MCTHTDSVQLDLASALEKVFHELFLHKREKMFSFG